MRRSWLGLKGLLIVSLLASLLSGCGAASAGTSAGADYPLESVAGEGDSWSRVYRAAGKSVPEVADEMAAAEKPQEISERQTERMFLVYPDRWVHLQQYKEKPEDTLIEISSRNFVQQNYDPSFIQTYFAAVVVSELIDEVFDAVEKSKYGKYRGYASKDTYKPIGSYRKPTTQEIQSVPPPVTKQGTGSIVRRSDSGKVGSAPSASGSSAGSGAAGSQSSASVSSAKSADTGKKPSVGDGGSVTKKETPKSSASGSSGSIIRNNSSSSKVQSNGSSGSAKKSITSPPRNNSPPKTTVGSRGSISRRK